MKFIIAAVMFWRVRVAHKPQAHVLQLDTAGSSFSKAGAPLASHIQPALRTGLMAHSSHLLHVSRGVVPGLT